MSFKPLKICPLKHYGVSLELPKSSIVIDPLDPELDSVLGNLPPPITIIFTRQDILRRNLELSEEYTLIAPTNLDADPNKVLLKRETQPAIITDITSIYFVTPPSLSPATNSNQSFIYIHTGNIEIIYAPRQTYIENPPRTDLILTYYPVYENIARSTGNLTEYPHYFGSDAQYVAIMKSPTIKIENAFIFINKKACIITYRHFLELIVRIIQIIKN